MATPIDLAGQRFGAWEVIELAPAARGHRRWRCRCRCGQERFVAVRALRGGSSHSCGCLRPPPVNKKNLTGQRFGRLVVLQRAPRSGSSKASHWLCQCDCGKKKRVWQHSLTRGLTKSCGCYRNEVSGSRLRTHGQKGADGYGIWKAMRQRCLNPRNPRWWNYGGRGITIAARWADFAVFAADMGPRPSRKHSIERINNEGPYSPDNCRWATPREQCNNRSTNHVIEHDGQQLTIAQWGRATGLSEDIICSRIEHGWTEEMALSIPTKGARKIAFFGQHRTIPEWAARIGLSPQTLYRRFNNGWSIEQALGTPKYRARRSEVSE